MERGKEQANGLHAFARGNPGGDRVGSVEKAGQGICDGFAQRRLGYAESRIARANTSGLVRILEKVRMRHLRPAALVEPDPADHEARPPYLGGGEDPRSGEEPHRRKGCFSAVREDDAHEAPASRRYENGRLDDSSNAHSWRERALSRQSFGGRHGLFDGQGRAQVIPPRRQDPYKIEDASDAVFGEGLACGLPEAGDGVYRCVECERRKRRKKKRARARKSKDASVASSVVLDERKNETLPVRALLGRNARGGVMCPADEAREAGLSRFAKPERRQPQDARERVGYLNVTSRTSYTRSPPGILTFTSSPTSLPRSERASGLVMLIEPLSRSDSSAPMIW